MKKSDYKRMKRGEARIEAEKSGANRGYKSARAQREALQQTTQELHTAMSNLRSLLWLAAHQNGGSITLGPALLREFKPDACRLDVEALPDNGGFKVIAAWMNAQ